MLSSICRQFTNKCTIVDGRIASIGHGSSRAICRFSVPILQFSSQSTTPTTQSTSSSSPSSATASTKAPHCIRESQSSSLQQLNRLQLHSRSSVPHNSNNNNNNNSLATVQHRRSFSSTPHISSSASADDAKTTTGVSSYVSVLKLNMLQDNPGAVKRKKRIGRGIGSGRGKTSTKGHKGQKARAGGSIPLGFEGGQTKFFKLLPKKGFTNKRHKQDMIAVNLGTIQDQIDMGRLVPNQTVADRAGIITLKDLMDAGVCTASSVKHGVKLLAKGKERFTAPVRLEVSRASREAIEAVESIGGEVTTVHYNQLALRALLKPHKFVKIPKFARPPPRLQPYYTNWDDHRGYLSVQAQMRDLLRDKPELEEPFEKALKERNQTLD